MTGSRKRRGRTILAIIVLGLAVGISFLVYQAYDKGNKLTAVWSDGSEITIRGVVAGTNEFAYDTGQSWNISRFLPTFIQRFWPSGGYQTTVRPDSSLSLGVYMTRQNPTNRSYLDVFWSRVETVDDAGNVFCELPGFTGANGLIGFSLQSFPRREKSFRLRMHGPQGKGVAEFVIPNPFPSTNYPQWKPESYPITKINGNVQITLSRILVIDSGWAMNCYPDYQIQSPDSTWTGREHVNHWFTDATGNKGQYLSPKESAWQLHMQVFRPDDAKFPTNVTWTLPLVTVPNDLCVSNLQASNTVDGISISAPVFCGGGILEISNYVHYSMRGPVSQAGKMGTSWANQGSYMQEEFGAVHPFVVVETGEMPDSTEILVRFRDAEGRLVSSKLRPGAQVVPKNPGGWQHRYCLELKDTNVDAIHIEIVVNRPKEFEFLVKPPKP